MPWKETCPMDQRVQLVSDWLRDDYTITELSQVYGVSRKTIYKWIGRYKSSESLKELPRAPLNHPNATSPEIVNMLIETKLRHRTWGPRKIVARLEREYPESPWPATSTASRILKREGLVKSRILRRRPPPYNEPFRQCEVPNDVWSIDFKGQFRMGDGRPCYPLTISDNYSRYLLRCQGLCRPAFENTKLWLYRACP